MKSNLSLIVFLFYLLKSSSLNAQYSHILDFSGADGRGPLGSLISDGTFLYGMTGQGGLNDSGAIFKIGPTGSNYTKLYDFIGSPDGSYPTASLVSDGSSLYGMTSMGGVNNLGTIFKIESDGSNYHKLLDFSGTVNGNNLNNFCTLILDSGFLYGMTYGGGTNNCGTIFKIDTSGNTYIKLYDFLGTSDAKFPAGSLFSDGIFLYGSTTAGGSFGAGTIFKIHKDGSGYTILFNFSSATGGYGVGSLISDGTFLYGMTNSGGNFGGGTVYKILPDGSGFLNILHFSGSANGKYPNGSLIYDGNFLYGMTTRGGVYGTGLGSFFMIQPDGTLYTKLHDFTLNQDGFFPWGSLLLDNNSLFGMVHFGGTNSDGIIFRYDLTTEVNTLSKTNSQILIYPNPVIPGSEKLFINSSSKIGSIKILDITGREQELIFYQNEKTETELNIHFLADGIYFLQVETEKGIFTKRLIKG